MKDQAENLRIKLRNLSQHRAKTIGVVSGKGGVGKSNISSNMAVILVEKGYKVLLFDMDIGMGNVHYLLGGNVTKTMGHFLQASEQLIDIIQEERYGVSYIAGGNGLNELTDWSDHMLDRFFTGFRQLQEMYDYIIFDMGAGASEAMLRILLSTDEIIVITTPEPTAIIDAYSMMKYIQSEREDHRFLLICNRTGHRKEGEETFQRISHTVQKFLQKQVLLLGILPEDQYVRQAVLTHCPVYIAFPKSSISLQLEGVVNNFINGQFDGQEMLRKSSFLSRLRRFFTR